ncbi:hypothetical protein B0H34DRAFT_803865 [Crassisporium funariophilum]|nr:hypothetical protein B0H34DRAFT_803865 [Crassisporium funariophilum]
MTSTSIKPEAPQLKLKQDPLRLFANFVSTMDKCPSSSRQCTPVTDTSAGSSSSPSSQRSCSTAASAVAQTSFPQDVASLHIPCKSAEPVQDTENRTLRHSTSPNDAQPRFVPFIRHGRRTRKSTDVHLKTRLQMKVKRKELLQKATKIKSLENSPVNERQLLVLRMVYDEITMYPCESWMALIAIIINRAYKQVKNWFSNERQKSRTGESIPFETEDGDKVRLLSSALSTSQEWSDSFFEEVLMIYHYRIVRHSRYGPSHRDA